MESRDLTTEDAVARGMRRMMSDVGRTDEMSEALLRAPTAGRPATEDRAWMAFGHEVRLRGLRSRC